jgi:parallel beta-helix repeat protein
MDGIGLHFRDGSLLTSASLNAVTLGGFTSSYFAIKGDVVNSTNSLQIQISSESERAQAAEAAIRASTSTGGNSQLNAITICAVNSDPIYKTGCMFVCNGTSDTIVFQNALDYIYSQGGGELDVMQGTYTFNKYSNVGNGYYNALPVYIHSNTKIAGKGNPVIFFNSPDVSGNGQNAKFVLYGPESFNTGFTHDITVDNLTLKFDRVNVYSGDNGVFYAGNNALGHSTGKVSNVRIQNCKFINCQESLLLAENDGLVSEIIQKNYWFENNLSTFDGISPLYPTGTGVGISGVINLHINNNTLDCMIVANGSKNIDISNNILFPIMTKADVYVGSGIFLHTQGIILDDCKNVSLSHNIVYGLGEGFIVGNSTNVTMTGNQVHGCVDNATIDGLVNEESLNNSWDTDIQDLYMAISTTTATEAIARKAADYQIGITTQTLQNNIDAIWVSTPTFGTGGGGESLWKYNADGDLTPK